MTRAIAASLAQRPGRSIVAIDGVDGAGKTTFADQLATLIAPLMAGQGRTVLRASVDGFHHPKAWRYQRGRTDPLGYFLHSYNYEALIAGLIVPFKTGAEMVQTQLFDHRLDQPAPRHAPVPAQCILILDGIFLHRDELFQLWDYSIFLNVPFEVSFQRMAKRDGTDPDPQAESNGRYHLGQQHYLAACRPMDRASIVLQG